jgi:hypothetical protein
MMGCQESLSQVSNFGRLGIEFCKATRPAMALAGLEYWRVRHRISEGEEVSDFGWWCAREMRKYAEEAQFVGGRWNGVEG